jgi:DNA-binding Xre family transcriptional regulator
MNGIKINFKDLFLDHQKRLGRQISKSEAAQAIGMERVTFNKWMAGNLSGFKVETLIAICNYFGVPLSALLEYSPTEDPSES